MQWFGLNTSENAVASYSLKTGTELWKSRISKPETCWVNDHLGSVDILAKNNELIRLDRSTGKVRDRVSGIEKAFVLTANGKVLYQDASLDVFVEHKGVKTHLSWPSRLGRSRDIMGAAIGSSTVAVALFSGNLLFWKYDRDKYYDLDVVNAWLSDLCWNEDLKSYLGFGSLDSIVKGESMPVAIREELRVPRKLMRQFPGQREFCRGQFFDSGRGALLEDGVIWDLERETFRPFPI